MARKRKQDDEEDTSEDEWEEEGEGEPEQHFIVPPTKSEYMVIGEGQFLDNKEIPDGTLLAIEDDVAETYKTLGMSLKKVTGSWTPPSPPPPEE